MMNKLWKVPASISCFIFSGIFFEVHDSKFLVPWDFIPILAFDEELSALPLTGLARKSAVMENLNPFVSSYFDIIQDVTLLSWEWIALPSVILLFFLILSIMSEFPLSNRIFVATAALGGPVAIIPHIFSFRRDSIDLILIFTMIYILYNRGQSERVFYSIAFVFSYLLWLNHYTVWPFIPLFTVSYAVIKYMMTDEGIMPKLMSMITLSPIVIHDPALRRYSNSIVVVISRLEVSDIPSLISSFLFRTESTVYSDVFGEGIFIPFKMAGGRTYLPWGQYLALGVVCIIIVFLGIYCIYSGESKSDSHKSSIEISLVFASILLVMLLGARGYILRGSLMWPVVVLGSSLSIIRLAPDVEMDHPTNTIEINVQKLLSFLLAIIILVHVSTILVPNYPSDKRPTRLTEANTESAKFANHIPEDEYIQTSLKHGNAILIYTNNRLVRTGHAMRANESGVVVFSSGRALYQPKYTNSKYILMSVNGPPTVLWGSPVPTADRSEFIKENVVYDSGYECLFLTN